MEEDEQKQLEQEKLKSMKYRMYENEYPNKYDFVIVSENLYLDIQCKITKPVREDDYVSVYADLLEYLKEGFIIHKGTLINLRKRQINDLKKAFRVGKVLVLQVINVDDVKGYIDLYNRFVSPEEVDKCNLRYAKSKQVENIVKLLALRTYKSMEAIYKKVIWPLYKTHNHALDALKEIIEKGNLSILNRLNVNDEIKNELMNILKKRWIHIPIKIRADFKLTCFNFDGIEAIKEALLKGEKKST